MNIAFFGSSLVSAYWNGAATYYRGIIRALASRGHRVTFYEPDAFGRQQHRDIDLRRIGRKELAHLGKPQKQLRNVPQAQPAQCDRTVRSLDLSRLRNYIGQRDHQGVTTAGTSSKYICRLGTVHSSSVSRTVAVCCTIGE